MNKIKSMRILPAAVSVSMLGAVAACSIEPPLNLAESISVETGLPEVSTDIDLIWEIDPTWRQRWYYGWDDEDIRHFGPIDYPVPSCYESRIYFYGSNPVGQCLSLESQRIWGTSMTRRYPFGYHDILIWSNIDSDDGTQVLHIDERDPFNIKATTTTSQLNYRAPSRGPIYNNPEIFYAGMVDDLYVSHDPADYDYFDEARQVWVKKIRQPLTPLVYTYLVQVVLYNNGNRVVGTADRSGMSSLADGVSVHTGHTNTRDVAVSYDMRLKRNLPAAAGRLADILGGKLTTFGLCDMESWARSRATHYTGSRSDLRNHVMVDFSFSNSSDSAYYFDVTDQMQRQAHGGVITIEIDVDTLKIPQPGSHEGGSMFDPTIAPPDSISVEFDM